MGAEGIMDVNLFEFSDEDVPDENNAEKKGKGGNVAGENLAQPHSDGSDGGKSDGKENSSVAAVPFIAVPGGSGTNASLPKPPSASPDAKVDTSQLDAELAKMNVDALKNAQIPSPPTANPPAPSNPTEQQISTMSTNDANEEISGAAQASAGENAENPATNEEISGAAQASAEENAENPATNEEISGAAQASAEENAENYPDEAAENNAQNTNGPDPQFAHKTVQDLHADTTPPQTNIAPAEYVSPLATQNVDYQTPPVPELEKHPTIPKKQTQNGPIAVEKMPIILTFETGRQKITIGELEKIREGYTFECANPTNAPVTICANDTPIGTGELLDVDGRIGVRIIEFYNK